MENNSVPNVNNSTNVISSRLNWMDALKLFTIFLVLWGHCVQYFVSTQYYEEPVYRFIYSFHMPLFMCISGFFAANIAKRSFLEAFSRKFRQLILPAISFGIITFLTFSLYAGEINFKNLPYRIFFNFWFLKSAFLCAITYLIISKIGQKHTYIFIGLIILTLIFSQFIHDFNIYRMYPCFLFGIFLNKNWKWIKLNEKKLLIISGTIFFLMSLFWGEQFWHLSSKRLMFTEMINGNFSPLFTTLFRHYYRLLIGFAGTLFFIIFFEWLSNKIPTSKFNDFICKNGQYTLGIYILQSIILETIMAKFLNFDNNSFFVFNFILCPLISLFVLILCIAIIKTIKISKILNYFLLGEKQ